MIIKLHNSELENLEIIFKGKKALSARYFEERDTMWGGIVEEGRKAGKEFWNGSLYSFEGIDQTEMHNPKLYFGEMEYKDVLFKKRLGVENTLEKYGRDHILVHCGVSVNIITSDKKFVIGRKKTSTRLVKSLYSHISGNLNKDEMEVTKLEDLYQFAIKEVEEESKIQVDRKLLKFNQINIFNSYCNFDFIYSIPLSSTEISTLYKDDEFETLEAKSYKEILELEGISDFEFSKQYLNSLL